MLARKAEEYSTALVYFSCWRSVVVVKWAKDNVVRVYF
jgi:hypothetical protein